MNGAMDLDSHLLLLSRPQILPVNAERLDLPQTVSLVQSCRLQICGKLFATITRNRRGLRRYSGFSSASDCGFSNWKSKDRETILIRRSFATVAVSENSGDAGQNLTEAAKCPCLYHQASVSSGNTIQYPGSVVVLGDVQEGGAVIADGDIVVLGRLYGDVHGGRNGNKSAVVYATQLDDACHIRISESDAMICTSQFGACPVIFSVQEDGTLGIRAAALELDDIKVGRNSSELRASAEEEASIGSEGTASKRPAQLALFTGVYISAVGIALLIFPIRLFGALFDVRTVTVEWIRVGAILAVVFGVYYIGTALGDMRGSSGARAFYMSTVVGRVFLFFGFCWLVAAGAAQRALLLVGTVNMLGAMSMLFALQQGSGARAMKA